MAQNSLLKIVKDNLNPFKFRIERWLTGIAGFPIFTLQFSNPEINLLVEYFEQTIIERNDKIEKLEQRLEILEWIIFSDEYKRYTSMKSKVNHIKFLHDQYKKVKYPD